MGDPFCDSNFGDVVIQDAPIPVVITSPNCNLVMEENSASIPPLVLPASVCPGNLTVQESPQPIVITQPICNTIIEGGQVPIPPIDPLQTYVVLGSGSWQTTQPFRFLNGVAMAITATDIEEPWAHGITLESGVEGQTIRAAIIPGRYTTALVLPGVASEILWMAKTPAFLTIERPTRALGYEWALVVAHRAGSQTLIFEPKTPMKL